MLLGVLSRFIGLLREVLVAGLFGARAELDAVFLGLSLPITLCLGIGGGLTRTMVPVGAAIGKRQLGGLLRVAVRRTVLPALGLSAMLLITSPLWVWLLIPSGSELAFRQVLVAGAAGSLALGGAALAGILIGIANARGRHASASFSPLVYNVIVIAAVLLLARDIGAYSLLVGVVLAEWGQSLALLPFIAGIERSPARESTDALPGLRALFLPAVFLSMANGFMGTVDRVFAAGLPEGSVSALAYAERLLNLPVMLIGLSLQQPLYTRLSTFTAKRNRAAFEKTVELGVRLLLLAGVPAGVALACLARPLIALLLQRGAFSAEATELCARVLVGYAPGVVFLCIIPLLTSAALARRRGGMVVAILSGAILLNALLDALLVGPFGLLGISISTSCVSGASVVVMLAVLVPHLLSRDGVRRAALFALLAAGWGTMVLLLYSHLLRAPGDLAGLALHLGGAGLTFVVLVVLPLWSLYLAEWKSLRLLAGSAGAAAERER